MPENGRSHTGHLREWEDEGQEKQGSIVQILGLSQISLLVTFFRASGSLLFPALLSKLSCKKKKKKGFFKVLSPPLIIFNLKSLSYI